MLSDLLFRIFFFKKTDFGLIKWELSDYNNKLRFPAKWSFFACLEFVDLEDFMDLDLDQSTFDLVYYVLIQYYMIQCTDYGQTKAKFLILCGPSSNPNHK